VPSISDIRNENTLNYEFPFFCACLAVRLLTVGGTWAGRSLGIASLAKRNGGGTTVEVDTLREDAAVIGVLVESSAHRIDEVLHD